MNILNGLIQLGLGIMLVSLVWLLVVLWNMDRAGRHFDEDQDPSDSSDDDHIR